MIAVLLAIALALQFNQRPPLTPAETLLESVVLRAITDAPVNESGGPAATIVGSDAKSGTIALTCRAAGCDAAGQAVQKLRWLVGSKGMARPARSIWLAASANAAPPADTVAVIHVASGDAPVLRIARGLWSTAGIGDEVVEIFARQGGAVETGSFENVGQPQLDRIGVPTTAIVTNSTNTGQAASAAAAAAYFLATLPNEGTEALLAHLPAAGTVSFHSERLFPHDTGDEVSDSARAIWNRPLGARADGETLLRAVARFLDREGAAFDPELLIIAAGFDGHADDAMSEWQVSTEEYAVLLTLLRDFAERHCAGRMLVTLEGGYDPMALEDCVLAMLKVLA